uniref:Replication factor Mcm10 C-terminal domain-containing protein n=3 Tax=Spongospora subterranea TaxID=70186 RepID=A0A0H5QVR4_9EUKA|eukprot:CRZ06005.1 hypothetical protein [Spongospora subterranea]
MNVNGRPTYLKETPIYLPVLGKSNPSAAGSDLIDLDEAPAHVSVLKAVQRLAGSRITPPDPNSTKQPKLLRDLSAVSSVGRTPCLEANMRRVVRLSSQAVPGCSQNVGRYSLFDANNMVVLGSERAKTVANHKPTNMHLVEQADRDQAEKVLDHLETRETLAAKMQSVMSQNTTCHICHECNYTLERQPDTCRSMGHMTTRATVKKTWHRCKKCRLHTTALGRKEPAVSCVRCAGSEWERVSMYKGAELAELTPKLKITNEKRRIYDKS